MSENFLQKTLHDNNYNFSVEIQNQFSEYLRLMQQWNRVYNLTAIKDPQEMVLLHLIDSLVINPFLHGNRIIDVGTGAGLPGIPLAIINPDKHFVLLDSNSKKTRFLTQVVLELKLKNVEVVHARCEEFHPEQGFDSILSRAFASIQVMLAATQHLLNQNGQFLAMKGIYPEQEIREISDEFKVVTVHSLKIQGLDAERHLVCVGKK